jgi:hypothetical protein
MFRGQTPGLRCFPQSYPSLSARTTTRTTIGANQQRRSHHPSLLYWRSRPLSPWPVVSLSTYEYTLSKNRKEYPLRTVAVAIYSHGTATATRPYHITFALLVAKPPGSTLHHRPCYYSDQYSSHPSRLEHRAHPPQSPVSVLLSQ